MEEEMQKRYSIKLKHCLVINMSELEEISFQIISTSGSARSLYIEAIQQAKLKNMLEANQLIEEANQIFIEGHRIHAKLIQKEANGEKTAFQLLFMHAEDQLMSAEMFGILAKEFIDIYKII